MGALKRRAAASHRRRYTIKNEPQEQDQLDDTPSNPQASPEEPSGQSQPEPEAAPTPEPEPAPAPAPEPAPEPAVLHPTLNAASQTDPAVSPPPSPSPAPAVDDPDGLDPFSDTLEPAIEIESSDLAPADSISNPSDTEPVTALEFDEKPDEKHEEKVEEKVDEQADEKVEGKVDMESDEKPKPLVPGPNCDVCHEPTDVPRVNEDAGTIETLAVLPCGHAFGHKCLLQWLDQEYGQTCPLCRFLPKHKCGHYVMPALASEAPPLLKEGGKLLPKCQACRAEGELGSRLLKLQWQMEEARGMALVSMRQVPSTWAESRIEMEWQRLGETARKEEGPWCETVSRSWLGSQKGRELSLIHI